MYVLPLLDKKIRYIPFNQPSCQYCYVEAIQNDTKFGICDLCHFTVITKFKPISFEKFKKIVDDKDWRFFANYNYELFELAIKNKDPCLNHYKSGVIYEISRGPLVFTNNSDQIRLLMQNNFIN